MFTDVFFDVYRQYESHRIDKAAINNIAFAHVHWESTLRPYSHQMKT